MLSDRLLQALPLKNKIKKIMIKNRSGGLRFQYLPGAGHFPSLRPVLAHWIPCKGSPQPFPITAPKSRALLAGSKYL